MAVLGFTASGSILADARRLVKDAVADAYIEGLKDGGIPADEMTDDDALMIVELSTTQLEYVTDFVKAIRAARDDKAAQRDILDTRINLWTQSIEAAGAQGLASAKSNEMVEFVLLPGRDDTEESCKTCRKLLGQKHRRKWVTAHGLIPAPGNDNFECGGWRCPHGWMPIKG